MTRRQEILEFEANDYYAHLNLDVGATDAQVKKHFRQLALVWHPDKHPDGPERQRATEIFQLVNKAHGVLSDRQLRTRYDPFWFQKHQGRHRVIPQWALKAGTGRSGSVEGRAGSVGSVGSVDRCGSVGPDPFERQSPPANSPSAVAPGRRFSPGFSVPFSSPMNRPASRAPPPETASRRRESEETRPAAQGSSNTRVFQSSLRETRRAALAAELERDMRQKEAQFWARDQEFKRQEEEEQRRKRERERLVRIEQQRAAEQAEWLRKSFAAKDIDSRERGLIEEFRRKMAKQAEEIAAQARAAADAAAEVRPPSFSFVPEARPFSGVSGNLAGKKEEEEEDSPAQKKSVVSAAAAKQAATARASEPMPRATPLASPFWQEWSTSAADSVNKAASDAATAATEEARKAASFADEVSSGLSSLFSNFMTVSPSSWVPTRPERQEAKPVPANCPRCGKAMPQVAGANFCPHCRFVMS
eukprot:TRINITY_DN32791_c0_g1_i3.p1 TRINITY_DN32791_c0_g1~~TRINITY_DN32791_c0_g1_i3.p1  ORF type:complete len:481 (-),score=128.30 TRINITY_DN32791_c0_g1_i3:141-1562(-)